jgi:predicted nuclease of predicted toxin-antitoxin system
VNFLADESIDRQIVDLLRQDGHSVWYVAEMDPGIGDDVILDRANDEGVMLLTADKDFGELVFRQRRLTAGVVLTRLLGLSPDSRARIVSAAIR